ncbi:MAG TPA: helix-turn-helix transcriptional regulator [Niastella sp.]
MEIPQPEHPLISVIPFELIKCAPGSDPKHIVLGYYSIALKKTTDAQMKYGQLEYDFNTGIMSFMAPGQVLKIEPKEGKLPIHTGWLLLVHPDFLWNTPLARKIKQYLYFGYAVNEALHLSEKEEAIIAGIIQNIEQEYRSNIDKFTQEVIIAHLELLLTYCERFYHRQFITRKIANHKILERLEDLLTTWFNSDDLQKNGLPTVKYIAGALNVSPNYLSMSLKTLTGQSTQQHIHDKLIEKAKEKLSTTSLSVSEIAWELGFEHSQSFSKLFKSKTNLSPLEFRQSFN